MIDLTTVLPAGIGAWPEWWQAAAVFVATFVLEDAATIGAGFLIGGGLDWPPAFLSAFLGVWLGDIGLYAVARGAGRPWFERRAWFRRLAGRLAESERWFAEKGGAILVISRCVPGARLPTYLAAGFLRVPLPGFLAVTGVASLVWTAGVLALTHAIGQRVLEWLGLFKQGALALALGVGLMLVLLHGIRRMLRVPHVG